MVAVLDVSGGMLNLLMHCSMNLVVDVQQHAKTVLLHPMSSNTSTKSAGVDVLLRSNVADWIERH